MRVCLAHLLTSVLALLLLDSPAVATARSLSARLAPTSKVPLHLPRHHHFFSYILDFHCHCGLTQHFHLFPFSFKLQGLHSGMSVCFHNLKYCSLLMSVTSQPVLTSKSTSIYPHFLYHRGQFSILC